MIHGKCNYTLHQKLFKNATTGQQNTMYDINTATVVEDWLWYNELFDEKSSVFWIFNFSAFKNQEKENDIKAIFR